MESGIVCHADVVHNHSLHRYVRNMNLLFDLDGDVGDSSDSDTLVGDEASDTSKLVAFDEDEEKESEEEDTPTPPQRSRTLTDPACTG